MSSVKWKKRVVVVMALSMMLALVGCSSKSFSQDSAVMESVNTSGAQKYESTIEVFYDSTDYEEESYEEPGAEAEQITESGASAEEAKSALQERKLIKTVDMNVETKTFDATMEAVEEKVAELGGYIENLETYNGSSYSGYRSSRNASMTVRIPKQHLDTFLDTVAGISNVVRRSESVEDVTLTYVDLESHKKVLQAEQKRLMELIEEAEVIEDIITIETRLSDVRYQIESMESQLRTFDNKVDYSTVYLNVDEVKELTPVVEETALQRIAGGFVDSLKEIRDGLVEFLIWFVVNIPYFILWIVIFVVVVVVIKVVAKVLRKMNDRTKKKAENGIESGVRGDTDDVRKE